MRYSDRGIDPSDWITTARRPSAGVILRQRRLRGGWTPEQVAEHIQGWRPLDVIRIEQGQDVEGSRVARLATALRHLEVARRAAL